MILIKTMVITPHKLQWWQWGQILGVALPALLLFFGAEHPLFWAIAFHFFMDFTAQSDETAAGKGQNNRWVLFYHSFISGGYAGFIVGGLPGLFISVLVHFLIDNTNKFGITGLTGSIIDQSAHIATLIFIWWLFL